MPVVGGWHMPGSDEYFRKFISHDNPTPKANGFQLEHLHEALKHVTRWRVALDIGAHVGFWTRTMAEKFETVHAFEPSPDCYSCLVDNVADKPNVITNCVAIGDRAGVCQVHDDPRRIGNTGSRYVISGAGKTPIVTVDRLNLSALDFMKIDVEGFELQVLMGARESIKKFRPVISMEVDKRFSQKRYGISHGAAEELVRALGYKEAAHMRPDKVFVPNGR